MDELKVVQLITNLGGFGVLVFLVYCLVRYIPKHFQELAKERSDHQQAMILQTAEHRKSIEHLTLVFTNEMKEERDLCDIRYKELKADDQARYDKLEKEYVVLEGKIGSLESNVRDAKHEIANIAHTRAMEQQVKQAQERQSKKIEQEKNTRS